ncbi:MAG: hypothetical protein JW747_09550 [Candidatus Aminicenantes bacterium]|nr:hypothetical protein [Candidatus Aminicenantes bacterium]
MKGGGDSGTFSDLLTDTAFASLLFNSLTILGLFVLRARKPGPERPYKVRLYLVLPFLNAAPRRRNPKRPREAALQSGVMPPHSKKEALIRGYFTSPIPPLR